jgi:hypothetical protein
MLAGRKSEGFAAPRVPELSVFLVDLIVERPVVAEPAEEEQAAGQEVEKPGRVFPMWLQWRPKRDCLKLRVRVGGFSR